MAVQKENPLPLNCQTITRRTRLKRSLELLNVTSAEEEAVYWFLTRMEWVQNGYRDPLKDNFLIIRKEESPPDELTWRFSRAYTWEILRSYYNKHGKKNWNIANLMIMQQCSFNKVGLIYAAGKTYQYQSKKGKELCRIMIKNLTKWLSDYHKNKNSNKKCMLNTQKT